MGHDSDDARDESLALLFSANAGGDDGGHTRKRHHFRNLDSDSDDEWGDGRETDLHHKRRRRQDATTRGGGDRLVRRRAAEDESPPKVTHPDNVGDGGGRPRGRSSHGGRGKSGGTAFGAVGNHAALAGLYGCCVNPVDP
jgi:hypothetical protein